MNVYSGDPFTDPYNDPADTFGAQAEHYGPWDEDDDTRERLEVLDDPAYAAWDHSTRSRETIEAEYRAYGG